MLCNHQNLKDQVCTYSFLIFEDWINMPLKLTVLYSWVSSIYRKNVNNSFVVVSEYKISRVKTEQKTASQETAEFKKPIHHSWCCKPVMTESKAKYCTEEAKAGKLPRVEANKKAQQIIKEGPYLRSLSELLSRVLVLFCLLLLLLLFVFLNPSLRVHGDRSRDSTGTNISKLSQVPLCLTWHTDKPTNCSPVLLMLKDSKQARRNRIWEQDYAKP